MPSSDKAQKEENEQRRDWVGLESEDESGNSSAEEQEEEAGRSRVTVKRRKIEVRGEEEEEGEDTDEEEEGEAEASTKKATKKTETTSTATKSKTSKTSTSTSTDADADADADDGDDGDLAPTSSSIITSSSKLKPLTPAQLLKSKNLTAKTGVVYLSRVPPFMKPMKVKDLLSKFGPIGRIFLAPEDPKVHAKRVKYGGNKKKNFEEGWVEFLNKKDAKLCAETLNARIVGGKKGNFYHDDIWNIKYLPKFKWHHLQAQIAYENASRQAKMRAEIAKETKINKTFLKNYERAKMVENMQEAKKKKRKLDEAGGEDRDNTVEAATAAPVEMRRNFRQHKVKGKAAEEAAGVDKASKAKEIFDSVF